MTPNRSLARLASVLLLAFGLVAGSAHAGPEAERIWPSKKAYDRAMKNYDRTNLDERLDSAKVDKVGRGDPFSRAGAFGSAYRVRAKDGQQLAIRVYHPEESRAKGEPIKEWIERYDSIGSYFDKLEKAGKLPPELIDFVVVRRGLRVGKAELPVLKMPWLEGRSMEQWVGERLQLGRSDSLLAAARNFRQAVRELREVGIAHGDLSAKNILIENSGALRLVDYDAMFVPGFEGRKSVEQGADDYKHPRYTSSSELRPFNENMDNFSSIVIYLSLLAVADRPELWRQNHEELNMIFTQEDLADPDGSPLFAELAKSENPKVRDLAAKLARYAKGDAEAVPTLEVALGRPSKGVGDRGVRKGTGEAGRERSSRLTGKREALETAASGPIEASPLKRFPIERASLGAQRALVRGPAAETPTRRGVASAGDDLRLERAAEARPAEVARAEAREPVASRFQVVVPELDRVPKVSSKDPGLAVFLFDVSGSMGEPFAGQDNIKKIDALTDVANSTLEDLTLQFRDGDTFKNRLDIAAFTYDSTVRPAFGGTLANKQIVTINDLANNPLRVQAETDPAADSVDRPIWIEPKVGNRTSTNAGFAQAVSAVRSWARRPNKEHLVLGVHVTDGNSTDGDFGGSVDNLRREVEKTGGKLLMTNIHLSSGGTPGAGVVFPTEAEAARFDQFGQRLFELSSPVPKDLAKRLGLKGSGRRMMAYNASPDQLARVFVAGSTAAAQ